MNHTLATSKSLIGLLLAVACVLLTARLAAQPAEPPAMSDEQAQRLWNMHWREFAKYYIEHDGQFIAFRTYDAAILNSNGMSARDYEKQSAREFELPDGGRELTKQMVTKPKEEVEAATRVLPDFKPGEYGFIHSGEIDEVSAGVLKLRDVKLLATNDLRADKEKTRTELGRELMRRGEGAIDDAFRDFRRGRRPRADFGRALSEAGDLIDWMYEEREYLADVERENRRMELKLVGFDTARLVEGRRWPAGGQGVQIAVVKAEGDEVTAVPAALLKRGLTEDQFARMLASRKLDKLAFAQACIDLKRKDPKNLQPNMLALIEGDVDDVRVLEPEPEVDLQDKFE